MKDDDDIQDYVRPWRGLTDEEIEDIFCEVADGDYLKTARLIEAKLKEKNT